MLVKTDPHSPGEFRVNGSLRNTPEFYSAFDVKPGDNICLRSSSQTLVIPDQFRQAPNS
jgi:predicted metalloendopeptidase